MSAIGKRYVFMLFVLFLVFFLWSRQTATPTLAEDSLWPIRSVDTMKSSRDLAREKLHNPSFDKTIELEVSLIKDLGANYIALGTPYDSEFLPFLKRWVAAARKADLKVWFRGTFSNYEGWFNYPKNMSPQTLLSKTREFVESNSELFEDGDIFDPCPECENAGHWKQPHGDAAYNEFMRLKHDVLKDAFANTNKDVIYNLNSVIGGRAKDVLVKETFDHVGNVIALDHYAKRSENYSEYIKYFTDNFSTKVVFSEFGAPIPDIHGRMTEATQAEFVKKVFESLYKHSNKVVGINYWVLSHGTTALYNPNYTPRKAVEVIKDFFIPAIIQGNIKNTLGEPLDTVLISADDGNTTKQVSTDANGNYQLVLPKGTYNIKIGGGDYETKVEQIMLARADRKEVTLALNPEKPSLFYKIKLSLYNRFYKK